MSDFNFGNLNVAINRKEGLLTDDVLMLTPKGKEAAEEGEGYDSSTGKVLIALNDSGTLSIKDIAEYTKIPVTKVKDSAEKLMRKNYARKVSYGENMA